MFFYVDVWFRCLLCPFSHILVTYLTFFFSSTSPSVLFVRSLNPKYLCVDKPGRFLFLVECIITNALGIFMNDYLLLYEFYCRLILPFCYLMNCNNLCNL